MTNQDYFIALTEFHFMNLQTMSEIGYYPGMKQFHDSVNGVLRAWAGRDLDSPWPQPIASELITYMDKVGVDVAFCLREPMMDITGGTVSMSSGSRCCVTTACRCARYSTGCPPICARGRPCR